MAITLNSVKNKEAFLTISKVIEKVVEAGDKEQLSKPYSTKEQEEMQNLPQTKEPQGFVKNILALIFVVVALLGFSITKIKKQ